MNKTLKGIYISSLRAQMKQLVEKISCTERSILDLTSEDKIDMTEMEVLAKLKRAYVHSRFELEKILTLLEK